MTSDTFELMMELQELELVLQESDIVHGEDHEHDTEDLNEKIEKIRSLIPDNYLYRYDRMRQSKVGIVHEVNGRCKACHMAIPVGDLSRMRNKKIDPVCPSCSVFLLLESF